jgi:hypothetical protein
MPVPGKSVLGPLGGGLLLAAVLAVPCDGAAVIGTTTTASAHYSASHFYSHFANGHYWVAFYNGSQAVLYSSSDAVTWTSQGPIFTFSVLNDTNRWAVRYRTSQIIALGFNAGDNTRYYRYGTLGADGTVSWTGAEAAVGPPDATDPDLNALIANGRPVLWRAGLNGNGAFWRGSALAGPVWAPLPGVVPAYGLTSGFSAGAVFPTGGSDPDDLVVLRAFTQSTYAAGNHRLLALKWNDALGAYDGSWYDVSTLGGALTEDATTEVQTGADVDVQRKFTAVADTYGNIHAFYTNEAFRVVHYRKAAGFNNSWSLVSNDVIGGVNAAKLAVTAAANGNLILFYEKNAAQQDIWYRRFDGTSWGPETLLYPGATLGLDLKRALAPLEQALNCEAGLAFTNGLSSPPYDVNFSLVGGTCLTLTTVEDGATGTLTVTAPGSFEMRFNEATGGGIDRFFDLAADPTRTWDLAGSAAATTHEALLLDEFEDSGATWYTNERVSPSLQKLDVLEATPARVKLRAEDFYGDWPGGVIVPGLKGIGDYSVYGSGRMALRWKRVTTTNVSYIVNDNLELNVHYQSSGQLSAWTPYSQTDGTLPNAGTEDFTLEQIDQAAAKTDFLLIRSQDWAAADSVRTQSDTGNEELQVFWRDSTSTTIVPGSESWDFLTYFKPTDFASNADTAVTSRSTDYRGPDNPSTMVGGPWNDADENTAGDKFNEAEGAYLFTLDPTNGLRFTMNGATTTRYAPFFKIRQWRSLAPPAIITFDVDSGGAAPPVTLSRGVDYKAEVKPVARAAFADELRWHSTLESAAAVTSPDVGTPGVVGGTAGPAAGKYGQGFLFDAAGEEVTFTSNGDFSYRAGAVEFWFQPGYAHDDGVEHRLWTYQVDTDHQFIMRKQSTNQLLFEARNGPGGANWTWAQVAPADYSWRSGDWVHIRAIWDVAAPAGEQLRIYLNGVEPSTSDIGPVFAPLAADWPDGGTLRIGLDSVGNNPAGGVIDEFHLYSTPVAPGPGGVVADPSGRSGLAHGGLTTDASEYLADSTRNFPLAFTPVDGTATRRGQYAYFGSDSKYRGLNVFLATNGASGGSPSLQWQFWNGTSWVDLTVTDETAAFTRSGTIYWTGDPFQWSPYSVNGGPDLYYVRAYMTNASATYTTAPVESVIETDILLFQYCADVTSDNQEFTFAAPLPTAVKLLSFTAAPLDSAVDVAWRTASELDNLGFHLYRSLSETGPWERITPSLVPGLGSSPIGVSYTWRDAGLVNGTRYFYRLEDVDTSSVSTFHGPVSAVPLAAPSAPGGDGSGTGDDGTAGTGGGDGSGEDDISGADSGGGSGGDPSGTGGADASDGGAGRLPTCTSPPSSLPCVEAFGDPSDVRARVVERASGHAVVELETGGFEAVHEADGRVRVRVPGFEDPADPHAPALPFKRVMLAAPVGKRARLSWVREGSVASYPDLSPSAVGYPEMEVGADGTVKAGRRGASLRALTGGYVPRELARLGTVSFAGERKEQSLELYPLRYDGEGVRLSKRLRVRVDFGGREAGERGTGTRGRRLPRRRPGGGETLAVLQTTKRGLYEVPFESLFPGRTRRLSLDNLSLQRQGEAVSFHVEPSGRAFGPGSVLYFWSQRGASSTSYEGEVAYELVKASGGQEMPRVGVSPCGDVLTTASLGTASFETNRIYQSGLLEALDPWQWEGLVGGVSKAEAFALAGVDAFSTRSGRVAVWLQGGSDRDGVVDHHVEVSLNGTYVGDVLFDGKRPQRFEAEVPAALFREGPNELGVKNVGDTGVYSLVFLDRFSVEYPQTGALRSGVFEGEWSEGGIAEVSTLASVSAVDVTDPSSPLWLSGLEPGRGSVSLRAEAGRDYALVSPEGVLVPRVTAPVSSSLKSTENQADYILIAPQAFLPAAPPLLERRESQGLVTKAASLEEIASVFGHGEASGEAIRSFLTYAYHSWRSPSVRYVLLLGDASHDPRNFIGTSAPAPLPALFVRTSYLVTASDPALAAVNGDDLIPDLAIGRLPAQTAEQAQALVQKVLAWEDSGQGLGGRAVLVADNPDEAGDFEADVQDIATSYLSDRPTETIFLSREGAGTRAKILDAFDAGSSLISYVGHGGAAVWASENVLNSWDVGSLQAQSEQPVMMTMNCLNGYFVAPAFDSLAEAYLKAVGRGTIAAFSPSGLSVDGPAHQLHRALMEELVSGKHERLGDAILAAQEAYAETGLMPELLAVYQLLGDPATPIRP